MSTRLQGREIDVQAEATAGPDGSGVELEAVALEVLEHGGAWRCVARDAGGLWRALRYRGRGWGAPSPAEAATDPNARAYASRRAARRAGRAWTGLETLESYEASAVHATLGRVSTRLEARTVRRALRLASASLGRCVDGWTWRLWRLEAGQAVELVAERTGGARHWRRTGGGQ